MESKESIEPSPKIRKWLLFYLPLALAVILSSITRTDHDPGAGYPDLILDWLMIVGLSFVLAMIFCLTLFHFVDLLCAAFRSK